MHFNILNNWQISSQDSGNKVIIDRINKGIFFGISDCIRISKQYIYFINLTHDWNPPKQLLQI